MDTLDSPAVTGFQKTALKSVFSGQIANTLLFDSVANAQLVLDTLTESNAGELLSDLIGMWSESEKTAVRSHFTHEQVEAVRQTLKQYRAATHSDAATHETALLCHTAVKSRGCGSQ
jgi:Tfp pilus assembly pilus retraction ATPase PilT